MHSIGFFNFFFPKEKMKDIETRKRGVTILVKDISKTIGTKIKIYRYEIADKEKYFNYT